MERDPDPRSAGASDLDPGVAAVARRAREAGVPPWRALSVDAARRVEDDLFGAGTGPAVARTREFAIEGPGGDLPLRVYRPEQRPDGADTAREDGDWPVIVFYHGGGWVLGTLDSADDLCRHLADGVGALVISVDYRLAPEHPFPAAVEDAVAALEWASERARDLGGDPGRIAVAGTSAGGGLAAAAAARAADAAKPPEVATQALLYPMLDPGLSTPSAREHGDAPLLTRADAAWFWDQYLRSSVDEYNPLAVPSAAPPDLFPGTAPAVVATAGHDVLRDEATAHVGRLREAGVPVDHLHFPALAHGFLSMTDDSARAARAMDAVTGAIRSRLDR